MAFLFFDLYFIKPSWLHLKVITFMQIYISLIISLLCFEILCVFCSIICCINFSKTIHIFIKTSFTGSAETHRIFFTYSPCGVPLCFQNRSTWFSAECDLSHSSNTLQLSNSVSLFLICPPLLNLRKLQVLICRRARETETL